MREAIQKKIDDKLLAEYEKSLLRERSGKYSPSLFGRCYRLQYWNRLNVPPTEKTDTLTLRKFKAGHLFHDFVQGLLPEHKHEVKVETDDILGFADIVLPDEVVDIKSVHSKAFWYSQKKDYDVSKEKYTNILQVCTYALLLGKTKASLMFISKDDLCVDEYVFETDNWKVEVGNEIGFLKDIWDRKFEPEAKPKAYNGKECQYCKFLTLCKETEVKHDRVHPYKEKEKK